MSERLIAELKTLTAKLESAAAEEKLKEYADPMAMALLSVQLHRQRQRAFPSGYFADTSWEILIDLFIAKCDGSKVIVSDLGLDAKLPGTTVLRHLARLVDDGFVRRLDDPLDRRKCYVQLTEHGFNKIIDVFQSTAVESNKTYRLKANSVILRR
jgi:DNA-binding MarR family transcriptional regulator